MALKKTSYQGNRRSQTSKEGSAPGYLSTRPAHMTSGIVDDWKSCFNREKIRIHGCDEGVSGPPPGKPRCLQLLEDHIRSELQDWNPNLPKANESKLQVYREVFEDFIEAFGAYKPLLSSIKNEYETALGLLRDQIRELEPMRARLAILSEESDLRVMASRKEEREEVKKLEEECRSLNKVIDTMKEEQLCLQAQVSCLEKDLRDQYLAYREERDARSLLIDKMTREKMGDHPNDHEEEDILKLKLELKASKKSLTQTEVKLNKLQADYMCVVPRRDWDELELAHQEKQRMLEVLKKDHEELKAQHEVLVEEHRQALQERDDLQAQLEGNRTHTPRPEWDKCADHLGGQDRWSEISADLSSQQLLELVLTELGKSVPDEREPK